MTTFVADWEETLAASAAQYARTAVDSIHREFPSVVWHRMQGPDDPTSGSPGFCRALLNVIRVHCLHQRPFRIRVMGRSRTCTG
jgi:hypothetical protein